MLFFGTKSYTFQRSPNEVFRAGVHLLSIGLGRPLPVAKKKKSKLAIIPPGDLLVFEPGSMQNI
jgi:hypothetical protein